MTSKKFNYLMKVTPTLNWIHVYQDEQSYAYIKQNDLNNAIWERLSIPQTQFCPWSWSKCKPSDYNPPKVVWLE